MGQLSKAFAEFMATLNGNQQILRLLSVMVSAKIADCFRHIHL